MVTKYGQSFAIHLPGFEKSLLTSFMLEVKTVIYHLHFHPVITSKFFAADHTRVITNNTDFYLVFNSIFM